MMAEWEIANLVPRAAVESTLQTIDATEIRTSRKRLLRRFVLQSNLTRDEYIAAEHSKFRYSLTQVILDRSFRLVFKATGLEFLGKKALSTFQDLCGYLKPQPRADASESETN